MRGTEKPFLLAVACLGGRHGRQCQRSPRHIEHGRRGLSLKEEKAKRLGEEDRR